MNAAFRMLYRAGAWLDASESSEIARHGLLHLRAFKHLATLSLGLKEPRFPLHVKAHMLCHVFRLLQLSSRSLQWVENPLTDSCQQDETFVGVLARFSRRVSPKTTVHRTYDLYITALTQQLREE